MIKYLIGILLLFFSANSIDTHTNVEIQRNLNVYLIYNDHFINEQSLKTKDIPEINNQIQTIGNIIFIFLFMMGPVVLHFFKKIFLHIIPFITYQLILLGFSVFFSLGPLFFPHLWKIDPFYIILTTSLFNFFILKWIVIKNKKIDFIYYHHRSLTQSLFFLLSFIYLGTIALVLNSSFFGFFSILSLSISLTISTVHIDNIIKSKKYNYLNSSLYIIIIFLIMIIIVLTLIIYIFNPYSFGPFRKGIEYIPLLFMIFIIILNIIDENKNIPGFYFLIFLNFILSLSSFVYFHFNIALFFTIILTLYYLFIYIWIIAFLSIYNKTYSILFVIAWLLITIFLTFKYGSYLVFYS